MTRADEPFDPVQKPRHYNSHPSGIECIEVAHYFSFALGNVIKYLWRAGLKDSTPSLVDLHKAQWFLRYALEAETPDMHPVLRADHRSMCQSQLAKIVSHHNEEIRGVLVHVTDAAFCDDDRLYRTLLKLAMRELQIEIMRQQVPIERALEGDAVTLQGNIPPGALNGKAPP